MTPDERIQGLLEANNRLVERNRELQRRFNVAVRRQVAFSNALAEALRLRDRPLPDFQDIPNAIVTRASIGSISGRAIFEITGEELVLLSLAAKLEMKHR